MNASSRRHTRYIVPEGAFETQKLKQRGMIGMVKGWSSCRVRDISYAGLLILSKSNCSIGDKISLTLSKRNGDSLTFQGQVVNTSLDARQNLYQLGVAIIEPKKDSNEQAFLNDLEQNYQQAL